MRKRFFLLLIATLAFTLVNARQISEREAQLKAEQFFCKLNQSSSNRRNAPRKAPKLISASNHEELYIFNDKANGGYVVISGDDRMPDVLAYSYDGLYDDNDMPDNMKAWMDDYAEQVDYLRKHPEAKVKRQTPTERKNIDPLLTCWFGQDTPYNNKCPEVDGVRCPTGCVATAMAQIMYYYQWPNQTTDIIPGYTTASLEISIPEQPTTAIDWDNIRDDYRNNYSNEESDAVSTLMLLCGTAAEMDYDLVGSGASVNNAAKALRKYFDYNELLDVVNRGRNSDSWEGIIYDELRDSRPVYYSGLLKNGVGHAFVMDGYEDGYYHVNWGWGGYCTYVLMTDVGGFNYSQTAIVGIQPENPNNTSRYAVFDNGKMTLYYDTEKEHRSGTVIPHRDDWVNYANDITECVIDPSFANLRQWNLSQFFNGWKQLKSIDGIENLMTDVVTDMYGMFSGCTSLTSLDLSGFKTDNVTNMSSMFLGCSSLPSLDVSGFKTDNVTNMSSMFSGCSNLTSLDVSSFKTDNVTDMGWMFCGCSSLTSLDVSGFKTDNVTDMYCMFSGCSNLTSLDVSGFKTDNVTDMSTMFYDCSSLTSLDVSDFKTDNVTGMYCMFCGCSSLTSLDVSGFKTDNVTDMGGMFSGCKNLTSLDVSGFKTDNVTDMGGMFSGCKNLTSLDVSGFKTDNMTNMGFVFYDCSSLTSLDLSSFKTDNVKDIGCMFYGCSSLTSLDVSGFKTDNMTNMGFVFYDCSSLTSLDLSSFKTDNVKNMDYMFYRCSKLVSLDVSGFKTDNVTDMGGMFYFCSSLTSLDVSGFKTDNVTDMGSMFSGCSSLTSLDVSGFKTDNVTDMGSMFSGCKNLTSLDVSGFKTDNVTDMGGMFYGCSSLTSLDVSGFKTDNVTDMGSMFFGCSNLPSLDVSGFKTDNVTDMGGMFYFCSSLTSLDVSGFKTDNVTDMGSMFLGCSSLTSLDVSGFKTDNVTDMGSMFSGCSSLTSLDVSGFKTDNVTDMGSMFSGCKNLTSLDVSGFKTDNVTDMGGMFYGCSSLKKIYVGEEWTTKNVTSGDYMFYGCSKLIGGAGTKYTPNVKDYTYAHIDGGKANPGYLRDKNMLDEPYALLSEDNTVLTFYYDDQMESRQGMDVYNQAWEIHSGEIITVVFDESFANCTTLTSTLGWFIGLSKLKSILGMNYLKTDNVMDMGLMFYGCSSLTSLDLSSFTTDNVTNMKMMFYGCSSLTSLDLSSFTTDNVTNMEQMFSGCSSLKKIYVASGWTTINVKTGDYMFGGCSKLIGGAGTKYDSYNYYNNHASYAHIDGGPSNPGFFRDRNLPDFDSYILLSDDNTVLTFYFDDQMESRQGMDIYDQPWESHSADINTVVFDESFANCTTLTSTYAWFRGCSKLKSIMGMNNLKTDYVTDMGYMFYGCSSLTSLNLSGFKTDNVKFMPFMFENCENLTTIYVREEWNTSNVEMSGDMFSNCPKLVGGEGTTYDSNHTSADYAHIDGGVTNPGYFTYKDTLNTLTYMIDGVEYRSYRLKSGVDIIPEPKPTKDGYVFIGWDDIPATMPDYDVVVTGVFYPYGDVNTDNDIDVLDVVDIARYVVEIPSESFVKQLADVNKDGDVNLGDAVTLVNEIAGEQNFVKAKTTPRDIFNNDALSLTEWKGSLSLNLQNERFYTAFQLDLYVPGNVDVSKMMLNEQRKQGHQLIYNKVEDGRYRVAALSTSNNEFNGNEGELLNIALNGVSGDEVSVRNILFFDVKGNDYLFDDINGSNTTSLTPSLSKGEGDDIYDLQGRKRSALQRGVNIVGSKKVIVK